MTKFVISGKIKIGKRNEKFTKTLESKDEASAKELTYTLFGSEHGTKRRFIEIEKVEKSKE
jgi:large subunit ribosomal protein LX